MFWENKDIVVGASSHLIHGFHNLADRLKKKWDWELSFSLDLNGSCVSTFRLGSRVLQPETFEMRQ